MKHALKILAGSVTLLALAALLFYFLSEPDLHSTDALTKKFNDAATIGANISDAIRASPEFKSVTFGNCGHLDASPDSGPKGSLIFSPATGAFVRYSSFDEFTALNHTLLSGHEECRQISVVYMTIFPYRGQIDLRVDEHGTIRSKQGPVFFN